MAVNNDYNPFDVSRVGGAKHFTTDEPGASPAQQEPPPPELSFGGQGAGGSQPPPVVIIVMQPPIEGSGNTSGYKPPVQPMGGGGQPPATGTPSADGSAPATGTPSADGSAPATGTPSADGSAPPTGTPSADGSAPPTPVLDAANQWEEQHPGSEVMVGVMDDSTGNVTLYKDGKPVVSTTGTDSATGGGQAPAGDTTAGGGQAPAGGDTTAGGDPAVEAYKLAKQEQVDYDNAKSGARAKYMEAPENKIDPVKVQPKDGETSAQALQRAKDEQEAQFTSAYEQDHGPRPPEPEIPVEEDPTATTHGGGGSAPTGGDTAAGGGGSAPAGGDTPAGGGGSAPAGEDTAGGAPDGGGGSTPAGGDATHGGGGAPVGGDAAAGGGQAPAGGEPLASPEFIAADTAKIEYENTRNQAFTDYRAEHPLTPEELTPKTGETPEQAKERAIKEQEDKFTKKYEKDHPPPPDPGRLADYTKKHPPQGTDGHGGEAGVPAKAGATGGNEPIAVPAPPADAAPAPGKSNVYDRYYGSPSGGDTGAAA